MMFWIQVAATVVVGFTGFTVARNFVRQRLRYVDAVYSPVAPVVAAVIAGIIAWPFAALPLITATTAAVFGAGVGLGTASGVKALKRGAA